MKTKLILALLICCSAVLGAQISLVNPTQAYISVSVTGFVQNPGVYKLTPVDRLSDALEKAKSQPAPALSPELTVAQPRNGHDTTTKFTEFQGLRNVTLTRGKLVQHCDLLKFQRTGDMAHNPLLKDGDVIHVAPFQTAVSILGNVYLPGEYEYVEGDRLSDILAIAQGFTLEADQKNISIYRYKENMIDFAILSVNLSTQSAESIAIMPHDRVIVPQDLEKRRAWKITVQGWVKAPGDYLIGDNTTLYDILLQCGGPTQRGDLKNAVYVNGNNSTKEDPEFERLKMLPLTEMTPLEYNYLRTRLRQLKGRYSVDIEKVWQSKGSEANVKLHNLDYLYVPENLDMVFVSGQVQRPGLVDWVEGENWKYYIEAAGGFTNNRRAGGIRVIDGNSGNWIKPSKRLQINPGDMVFISEKIDRDLWMDFKDFLLITSQLVTIYIGLNSALTK